MVESCLCLTPDPQSARAATRSSQSLPPAPHKGAGKVSILGLFVGGEGVASEWFIILYSAGLHYPGSDSRRRGKEGVLLVAIVVIVRVEMVTVPGAVMVIGGVVVGVAIVELVMVVRVATVCWTPNMDQVLDLILDAPAHLFSSQPYKLLLLPPFYRWDIEAWWAQIIGWEVAKLRV